MAVLLGGFSQASGATAGKQVRHIHTQYRSRGWHPICVTVLCCCNTLDGQSLDKHRIVGPSMGVRKLADQV